MAKIVKRNPDGSYFGLVEREEDQAPPVPVLVTRSGQGLAHEGVAPSRGLQAAQNASESAYSAWSYTQLRSEVGQRGIDAPSRKKDVLIAALEAHDASR